jgi:RHS repeat-associated protein
LLRRYITGPGVDDRIAHFEISTATKTYYHTNHQGSVMAMTDNAGNVTESMSYDEYGNGTPSTGEQFGYTGRRFDPETQLYYYRARYYAPQLGRFLQTDPVGYKDDIDLYTYVGNDPLDRTDPTGQCDDPWCQSQADANTTPQGTAAMAWGIADSLSVGGATGIVPFGNANDPQVQAGYHAGTLIADAITVGVLGAVAANSAAETTGITANAAQGKAGEAITRAKLGDTVAGEQVSFKTNDGTRTRADFVTTDKSVVETKTGNATLSKGQAKLKSDIGAGRSVTPVGQNAAKAGLKPNEPIKMTCFKEDRPC